MREPAQVVAFRASHLRSKNILFMTEITTTFNDIILTEEQVWQMVRYHDVVVILPQEKAFGAYYKVHSAAIEFLCGNHAPRCIPCTYGVCFLVLTLKNERNCLKNKRSQDVRENLSH